MKILSKHKVLSIGVAIGFSMNLWALSDVGLLHRWSMNGDTTDSVGGLSLHAFANMGATTDGKCISLVGGDWTRGVESDGDICSADATGLTLEIWARQDGFYSCSSVFQIGNENVLGMYWDFSSGYPASYVRIAGERLYSSGSTQAKVGPYDIGKTYHLALVVNRMSDGSWHFWFYKQDATTGATLSKFECTKDSSWSFSKMNGMTLTLGAGEVNVSYASMSQDPHGGNASYDEVRVWGRALSEEELTESAKEGPDTRRFGRIPTMQWGSVYATNVVAHQRYPWNNLVDVEYDVVGNSEDPKCIVLQASDEMGQSVFTARSVTGDFSFSQGHHHVVWDLDADGINLNSRKVRFVVSSPMYCVIDLSAGKDAASYPVTYVASKPVATWTDEYKTSKLVMRWCGSGVDEVGMFATNRSFYAGIFEFTQGQWKNVLAATSRCNLGDLYPMLPDTWRSLAKYEKSYPFNGGSGSLLAALQQRTGLGTIGLPTTNAWNAACLAGHSELKYSFGDGWFYGDGNAPHPVGEKAPNDFGLYDMFGNVEECVIKIQGDNNSYDKSILGEKGYSFKWSESESVYASVLQACSYWSSTDGDGGFRLFMSSPWY